MALTQRVARVRLQQMKLFCTVMYQMTRFQLT